MGATGTNTVILFLEKRNEDFKTDRGYIAEDAFDKRVYQEKCYIDRKRLFKMFLDYRELNLEDYQTLKNRSANEAIKNTTFYKDYQNWFDKLTSVKNLKKRSAFKNKTEQAQKKELEKLFYDKVLEIEQEKFYFFMLHFKRRF